MSLQSQVGTHPDMTLDDWLFGKIFTSLQHLTSYQDGYRIVTACPYGWLHSAAPLENQAISTMTQYPSQSHYADTDPTLIMSSARLGNNKDQFYKSFDLQCYQETKLEWSGGT